MTPREWWLLQEGALDREIAQSRKIARWLSPLLSATAGQIITPAQLLGEDEPQEDRKQKAADLRRKEREMKAMYKKIAKREKQEKAKCQA